jgi:hypothetical protein
MGHVNHSHLSNPSQQEKLDWSSWSGTEKLPFRATCPKNHPSDGSKASLVKMVNLVSAKRTKPREKGT